MLMETRSLSSGSLFMSILFPSNDSVDLVAKYL